MLDDNNHLIQCIMDFQSKGKNCRMYQQMLHRNLVYLATIADSNQNMQSLLPAVSIIGDKIYPSLIFNHSKHFTIMLVIFPQTKFMLLSYMDLKTCMSASH
uniref:SS18 N-terminal domain-containing protein n=1 Tax=Erpetoichthys calabaricus TaxID=27687 RepID=A0A8C4RST5_ERPCA